MFYQRQSNFIFLLAVTLGFLMIPPFVSPDAGGLLTPVLLSIILVVIVAALRANRSEFVAACFLAAPALTLRWIAEFWQSRAVLMIAGIFWILLLALTVFFILKYVLTTTEVTYDTIAAAVCGYLLFGVLTGTGFSLIELLYPGSFAQDGVRLLPEIGHLNLNREILRFTYFSFITLAGLGYGDITPMSPQAQAVAPLEGIAGQFYIAVLIARLVSLHTASSLIAASGKVASGEKRAM